MYGKHLIQVHCFPSLRTADAFLVVAFSEGEKRRPEMRLLFGGWGSVGAARKVSPNWSGLGNCLSKLDETSVNLWLYNVG